MTFLRMPKRGSLCAKIISVFIIQTFLLSNIAFAIPQEKAAALPKPQEIIVDPEKIIIPREAGIVKSKYTGNSGTLVIHIQDAHCNFEAQSNIVHILENLIKNYNISFVSVEGADGVIDTSWFKAFPDEEVRKEVATYFMKKGEITGPEFLSITTDYPIKLFGAETRSYYIQNLNAFTSSYPLKDATEKYYNDIKSALNRLKNYIYNNELKAMDARMQDYESKKMQFNDYARFLQGEAEKHRINLRTYENFFRLVSVLIYEKKIDFNVTDKERSALIDELSKRIDKDALTDLVNQSLSFKIGKISSAEYYAYLRALAKKNDVDLGKTYPNLYNYIIYNSVYSRIENEKLFNDIKKLETDIKEKLFQSDDQRTLEKLSRHIDILIGLVNIKLLNGDFDYYHDHKNEFSHEAFADFIKKKTTQYGLAYEVELPGDAVVNSIPKLEDFYSIAVKRDKAIVDNTLGAMKKEKQQVAVLVTGGFHSEGIAKLLEKQGISYMVVCPTITKDVPSPYIQVLTNQRTPFEDILVNTVADTSSKQGMVATWRLLQLLQLAQDNPKLLVSIAEQIASVNGKDLQTRSQTFEAEAKEIGALLAEAYQKNVFSPPVLNEKDREGYVRQITARIVVAYSVNHGLSLKATLETLKGPDRDKLGQEVTALFKAASPRTPGTGSTGSLSGQAANGNILTPAQASAFNAVLKRLFADKEEKIRTGQLRLVSVPAARRGFNFVVHDGMLDALEAEGLPLNIHPSRGGEELDHNLLQAQLDSFIYDNLTDEERLTVANHELAHIDIHNGIEHPEKTNPVTGEKNGENKTYKAYVKARDMALARARQKGMDLDLGRFGEAFVNNFPGCDTAPISKNIAALLAVREKAQEAFTLLSARGEVSIRNMDAVAAMDATLYRGDVSVRDLFEGIVKKDDGPGTTPFGRNYLAHRAQLDAIADLRKIAEGVGFGDAVRNEIRRLIKAKDYIALKEFVRKVAAMRINAAKLRTAFIDYKGYGVIIVSSPDESITKENQKMYDRIFKNIRIENEYTGNKVLVLCVTDDIRAGQNTGQGIVLEQAIELAKKRGLKGDLGQLINEGKVTAAVYQDGGDATRKSPVLQSTFMSRAKTFMGGDIIINSATGETVPMTLDLFIIARTSISATTLERGTMDIFWVNQIDCATTPNSEFDRERGHPFTKVVVGIPDIKEAARKRPQDFFYYGLAVFGGATDRAKRWIANFYGSRRFAKPIEGGYEINPTTFSEIKDETETGFDYGSLNASWDFMWSLFELYKKIGVVEEAKRLRTEGKELLYKRDLDPHILQPLQMMLPELDKKGLPAGLPSGAELRGIQDRDGLIARLKSAEAALIAHLDQKCQEALKTTRDYEKGSVSEAVWFYLMYRDTDIFKLGGQFIGYLDLGTDTTWKPYKSAADDIQSQFAMLADLTGKTLELNMKTGEFEGRDATPWEKVEAENLRFMRGWTDNGVCRFRVDGREYTLTSEQVRKGASIGGVYIKNSIVQNCDLRRDSRIENSVVFDSEGLINADYALVENSIAPGLNARHSYVLNLASNQNEEARSEILVDCYRESLKGRDTRFTGYKYGQTRLRMNIRFDPKGVLFPGQSDETKQLGNQLTPKEIREAKLDAEKDKALMMRIMNAVRVDINSTVKVNARTNISPEWAVARGKYELTEDAYPMPLLGTSGERGTHQNQLTDIRIITMQAGNLSMLAHRYGIRPGDAIVFAGDRRPSTPRIVKDALLSTLQQKFNVNWQGLISTPAVVFWATTNGMPMVSIMVTASHNPVYGPEETYEDIPSQNENNGLKLNSPRGEVLKEDEPWLVEHIKEAELLECTIPWDRSICGRDGKLKTEGLSSEQQELLRIVNGIVATPGTEAGDAYILRNTTGGFGRVFDGEDIGFNQHTGVARDMLPQILEAVGLKVHRYGRNDKWIERMDTEDLDTNIERHMKDEARRLKSEEINVISHNSTDGDADRPALFDSKGNFIYGDKICGLSCIFLKELFPQKEFVVVVTATCSEAMVKLLRERYGMKVIKVEVGSPYVVSEMEKQEKLNPGAVVVGFERNTGFFIQTPIQLPNGNTIKKLATRDSAFVILSVNLLTKKRSIKTLEDLVDNEYSGTYESYSWSGGITNATPGCEAYTAPIGKAIMRSLSPKDRNMLVIEFESGREVYYTMRAEYYGKAVDRNKADAQVRDRMLKIQNYLTGIFTYARGFGVIIKMEFIDGVRVFFDNGEIVHLRPSGNEPKGRIYPESSKEKGARARDISKMKDDVYRQMIRDYITKTQTAAKMEIAPRSVEEIRASLQKLLPSLKIPETGILKTWEMPFGPQSQHFLEKGIIFADDRRSFTIYSKRTYNKFAEGKPQSTLEVRLTSHPDEKKVVYSEAKDGVEIMQAEATGNKAWVELGVGLDKNLPIGKFQDMIFPVMSQETINKFKEAGVVFLRLIDMTSENELEPSLWGPEDADVFEFKPIAGTTAEAAETPVLGNYFVLPKTGITNLPLSSLGVTAESPDQLKVKDRIVAQMQSRAALKSAGVDTIKGINPATGEFIVEEGVPYRYRGDQTSEGLTARKVVAGDLVVSQERYAANKDKIVYIMNHGFVRIPKAIADHLRDLLVRQYPGLSGEELDGKVIESGRIHDTFFPQVNPLIPGSIQYQMTGVHYQGENFDIKYVTEGRGIQYLVKFNAQNEIVDIIAQELKPGVEAYALPGYMDIVINLGGLRFTDMAGVKLSATATQSLGIETESEFYKRLGIKDNSELPKVENLIPALGMAHIFYMQNGQPYVSVNPAYDGRKVPEIRWVQPRMPDDTNLLTAYRTEPGYIAEMLYEGFTMGVAGTTAPEYFVKVSMPKAIKAGSPEMLQDIRQKAKDFFAALDKAVKAGQPINFKPNVRAGNSQATSGYNWGKFVGVSFILKSLGIETDQKSEAIRRGIMSEGEDVVSERWIASADTNYPSMVDVGTEYTAPIQVLLGNYPEEVFGKDHLGEAGPKLGVVAKLLDARSSLSLQTHRPEGDINSKPEMWIALAPQARAVMGFSRNVSRTELKEALGRGDLSALNTVKMQKGKPYDIKGGLAHSFGAGSFGYEVSMEPREMIKATASLMDRKIFSDEADNKPRDGKDFSTMKDAQKEEVLDILESSGMLRQTTPEDYEAAAPVVTAKAGLSEASLMIAKPGFVVERYTIGAGEGLPVGEILFGRPVSIFVAEGDAAIISEQGKRLDTLRSGEERLVPAKTERYILRAGEAKAVIYVQYKPLQGERIMYSVFQAMQNELARLRVEKQAGKVMRQPFSIWVPKRLYRNDGFKAERNLIAHITDGLVTLRQYENLADVAAKDNDVVVAVNTELENARSLPAINNMLKSGRILAIPKANVDRMEDRTFTYAREIEATAFILGNTTEEDIREKTSRAMDLANIISQMTGRSVKIEDLKDLLAAKDATPESILERLKKLIDQLLLTMPIERYEIDKGIEGRRQILWSV